MILTDGDGRPLPRPCREEFSEGVEGTIAHMRAVYAWKDLVANTANKAFAEAFGAAMRTNVIIRKVAA